MSAGRGNGDDVLARALVLGIVAGMRSQLPFALMAFAARRGRFAACEPGRLGLLRTDGAVVALGASAAGEIVVDKLPFVPSRLNPGPLAGRIVIGGAAGAALAKEAGGLVWPGAAAGAAGGLLGSFAGYWGRRLAGQATGLPDPAVALVEDAAGIALGWAALTRGRSGRRRCRGDD